MLHRRGCNWRRCNVSERPNGGGAQGHRPQGGCGPRRCIYANSRQRGGDSAQQDIASSASKHSHGWFSKKSREVNLLDEMPSFVSREVNFLDEMLSFVSREVNLLD